MASPSFVSDTIGDIQAAKYGGPHRSKVPRFRRSGAGRVFGLDEGLRIVSGSSAKDIEIAPGGRKRTRYTDLESQRKVYASDRKRVRIGSSNSRLASFVPIGKPHKLLEDDMYLGHEFTGADKGKISDEDEEDAFSSGDEMSDVDGISPQEELQERLRTINEKIRDNAQDIDNWLSLMALQEEVIEMALKQDKSKSLNSEDGLGKRMDRDKIRQSVAEVQFSVLEKASRAHPSNAVSVPLMMAKLNLAASSGMWDFNRIEQEWNKGISSCSSSWEPTVEMWNGYLAWRIGDSDSFVLEDVLELFAKALEALRSHYYRDNDAGGRSDKELESLHLIKKLLQVMSEAGFVERSNGLLQALSEMTFRRPANPSLDTEQGFQTSCTQLEDYWCTQDQKIGEKGSMGWSNFSAALKKDPASALKAKSSEVAMTTTFGSVPKDLTSPDPVVRWLALEKARSQLRRMPAKGDEEADWATGELEVDHFSIIFFDDIRPFLFPLTSDQSKEALVSMSLSSFDVPWHSTRRNHPLIDHCHLVRLEHFWPSNLLHPNQDSNWALVGGEMMQRPRESVLSDPFQMPIKTWPRRVDNLFPASKDKAAPWFALWDSRELGDEAAKTAKLMLEQLSDSSTSTAIQHLGLCASLQTHKVTVKLAKQLLNLDRDSIPLWLAFARLERSAGNAESARKVYKSLLVVDTSTLPQNLGHIWVEWVELEWEEGEHSTCMRVLSLAADSDLRNTDQASLDSKVNSQALSMVDILRTRRAFEHRLATPDGSSIVTYCHALFQYLSQDVEEAFEVAMKVFKRAIESAKDEDIKQEDIALTHCKFIWRHINGDEKTSRWTTFIPKDITFIFSTYVLQFPHNSIFVALLAAFEMRTKVENVLRKVLEEKMQRLKGMAKEEDWLTYIYCELHMNLHSVNENAIRSLFERAVEAKSTANSSLLWQLYVQFEAHICRRKDILAMQSHQTSRQDKETRLVQGQGAKADQRRSSAALLNAKSVLYRAIRKVPYCKALYLAAFAPPLRPAFTIEELLQLSQLMQEKDLRFFTNLSTFVTPEEEGEEEEEQSSDTSSSITAEAT